MLCALLPFRIAPCSGVLHKFFFFATTTQSKRAIHIGTVMQRLNESRTEARARKWKWPPQDGAPKGKPRPTNRYHWFGRGIRITHSICLSCVDCCLDTPIYTLILKNRVGLQHQGTTDADATFCKTINNGATASAQPNPTEASRYNPSAGH